MRHTIQDMNEADRLEAWLNEEQLKNIPPDLIDDLLQATVLLDNEHCLKAVDRISDHNHELGKRLRCMVKNFKCKEILEVLDNFTREESK